MSPIRTTKASIDAHKRCITHSDLSPTFRDAVRITRELGHRYLWIDSLCIVQDDRNDWMTEAQNMPDIYGSSILTLAALSSANGSGGCRTGASRGGEDFSSSRRRTDIVNEFDQVRFFEQKPAYWYREYGDNPYKHEFYGIHNPLRTRAWTLQERELPVRSIHFSEGMLLWQCRTMKGSSELPWTEIEPMDDFLPILAHNETSEDLQGAGRASRRARWFNIVEDYTTRFLTLESDKLPALHGLATQFMGENAQEVGQYYVAGVFRAHMPSALMWRVQPRHHDEHATILSAFQPRRPMKKRAPSWSWAALDGPVTYDSQRLSGYYGLAPIVQSPTQQPEDFCTSFTFASGKSPTRLPSHRPETAEDATLLVTGRVVSLRTEAGAAAAAAAATVKSSKKLPLLTGDSMNLVDADKMVVGVFFPDISSEVRSANDITCLEVRRELYHSEVPLPECLRASSQCHQAGSMEEFDKYPMVMGLGLLALVDADEEENVYQRIGIARWISRGLFDDVDVVKLRLV